MSVNVTTNSSSQDYTHQDDHALPTYDMTPGAHFSKVLVTFRAWSYILKSKSTEWWCNV